MSFSITDETTIDDVKTYLDENDFTQEIVIFLLENGTVDDLNTIEDDWGYTALMWASKNSKENTVKMLIDAGADLNIQAYIGNTALMWASSYSSRNSTENTVKMLIDAGADLNIQNKFNETAVIKASKDSNRPSTENTVRMLIDAGADLNIKNKLGNTALIYASNNSSENTVKMLIDKGADLNIQNDIGNTALMNALLHINRHSKENTVKMLIDADADLNIKNKDGETAYDILKRVIPGSYLLPLLKPTSLLDQRIRVNISKTVSFEDPIMLVTEQINIEDYIEEDKDNIVIVYNKNRYFFTTRDNINNQKDDATVFPCLEADTMNPENILRDRPLYNLIKIGFVGGYHCDMEKYYNNQGNQLFALINTDEKYASFVSDNVLNRAGSYVSGMHCQEGQGSKISYMIVAVPSNKDNPDTVQMGGFKKRRTIKKVKGKKRGKNKKRKTIKKRSKY